MGADLPDNGYITIGVISDTHGHLPPAALRAFAGVEHIIHAGDIGGPEIIDNLRRIAPLTAVKGNMDGGRWTTALKATEVVDFDSVLLYVIHDLYGLDLVPEVAGMSAVICGHTHQPASAVKNGVLFLNPGSASLPRRGHPPTVAIIRIERGALMPEFVRLGG
jgi:putative phosphoesterase